jgi:hypothetical protein
MTNRLLDLIAAGLDNILPAVCFLLITHFITAFIPLALGL